MASLSNAMRQRMASFEAKGYSIEKAVVSYILAWRPRDEQEEIAVCLANLYLRLSE